MRPPIDRNRKLRGGERGADVRGHVVGAFGGVAYTRSSFGHQALEKSVEVEHDIGIGILLNHQATRRCAGMKTVSRPAVDALWPRNQCGDFAA